jgi:hypothetical protein
MKHDHEGEVSHNVPALDKLNEQIDRAKQHLKNNKKLYIVGTGCLIAGGFAGGIIGKTDVKQTVDSLKLIHIQYKSPNYNLALVKRECMPPMPVRDKMTGIPYPSLNVAAKHTGQTVRAISKDAHGLQEQFERLPDSVFA